MIISEILVTRTRGVWGMPHYSLKTNHKTSSQARSVPQGLKCHVYRVPQNKLPLAKLALEFWSSEKLCWL
jgi:hypothetical protein